jgi:hypothetical protein
MRRCDTLRWTGRFDGELDGRARVALHAALDADGELERDTAFLVTGLSRVGLDRVFLQAFARRLAAARELDPPARAVLWALQDTVAFATRAPGRESGVDHD